MIGLLLNSGVELLLVQTAPALFSFGMVMMELFSMHILTTGDVNALVAAPSQNRVFSAGSDGQLWIARGEGGGAVFTLCSKKGQNIKKKKKKERKL